jgi:Flp pilus assembly protein TadG
VRRREEGSILVIVGIGSSLFVALILLLLHTGKMMVVRKELQTAADSTALAAALALRERGMQPGFTVDVSEIDAMIHQHTTSVPYQTEVEVQDNCGQRHALVRVTLTAKYKSPFNPLKTAPRQLSATAHARVPQYCSADSWPAVVVVLDASASMKDRVGVYDLWQLLTKTMVEYTSQPFPVRNGVVAFNKKVVAAVPPPNDNRSNVGAIAAALGGVLPGRLRRPDGW